MKIKKIKEMKKDTFDFSEALRRMKEGKKVKRRIWSIMEQHLLIRRKFTSDLYPLMIYGGRII